MPISFPTVSHLLTCLRARAWCSQGGIFGSGILNASPPAAPPPLPPPGPISPAAAPGAAMSINGHWLTNWGNALTITPTTFYDISSFGASETTIDTFGQNYFITQNSPTASFYPSKWNKVQFHTVGTGFGYCSSVYDANTRMDALTSDTTATYDPTNAESGCGASGFGHTIASPYNMPIAGTYLDNWGSYITINNNYWYSGNNYNNISVYSQGMALIQTSPTAWDPLTWSKMHYHTVGTGFGFCTTAYGQANASDALKAPIVYNASDAASGCGASGFGHNVATPYNLPIAGTYTDSYQNTPITVSNTQWISGGTVHNIEMYTNEYFVYQVPDTATYNPGKWSKIHYHTVGTGFGYCTTAYGQDTATAALMAAIVYNASDAASGCGSSGFGHSVATPTTGR